MTREHLAWGLIFLAGCLLVGLPISLLLNHIGG